MMVVVVRTDNHYPVVDILSVTGVTNQGNHSKVVGGIWGIWRIRSDVLAMNQVAFGVQGP